MRRRLLVVAIVMGICVGMSGAAAAGAFQTTHALRTQGWTPSSTTTSTTSTTSTATSTTPATPASTTSTTSPPISPAPAEPSHIPGGAPTTPPPSTVPTVHAPAVEHDCTAPTSTTTLVVEPTSIVIACADAGVGAEDLSWSSWRATAASGSGVIWWHDCTPNCASSTTFEHYPAEITLSGVVKTPKGPVFSVMSVAYTTSAPRRQPTGSPIVTFTLEYPGE